MSTQITHSLMKSKSEKRKEDLSMKNKCGQYFVHVYLLLSTFKDVKKKCIVDLQLKI